VAALAAQAADDDRIRAIHLRSAARDWYQRDKEAPIRRTESRALLDTILDEVIGRRQKRTFLLRQDTGGSQHYLIRGALRRPDHSSGKARNRVGVRAKHAL
jgi:hypothetical protein